ncbi:MAG: reverse transcriptase-like protein, partial [Nocardioidaceae bacterium]
MAVAHQRVILEADGGSRGNPGPAGFGALIRDADTGEVIAEAAESIGRASNNVAEYRGLIAGLELYREHTPDARLEARMDSKLVIEQMAGRWKVKHPDMRPLAIAAQRLAPSGTLWTWVPRERNSAADRLANLAMDAAARGEFYDVRSGHGSGSMTSASGATNQPGDPTPDSMEPPAPGTSAAAGPPTRRLMRGTGDGPAKDGDLRRGDEPRTGAADPMLGWSGLHGEATTLILLRHGETRHTAGRKFSGPGGDDPELNEIGWRQVQRAAQAISADGGV